MFTGLIEDIGTIIKKESVGNGIKFSVQSDELCNELAVGDSVNINGACQTVIEIKQNIFSFISVEETLKKTNLGNLTTNNKVNLERALKANSRLGGHFVLGHVDCIGTIKLINKLSTSYEVFVKIDKKYSDLLIPVGSIAVDGISLTLAEITESGFKVAIIPHTWNQTIISIKKPGESVNIEFDILGKYVKRILTGNSKKEITEEWLKKMGF